MSKNMHRTLNKNKIPQAEGPAFPAPPIGPPPYCRILVVDGNSDLRLLYADALTRPDCWVDVVADGEAAWAALQARRYNLLITENEMPTLAGDQLLKKLRSARMELPVVIVAEGLPTGEPALNSSSPCAATLLKPFALDALMDTVKSVMRTVLPEVSLSRQSSKVSRSEAKEGQNSVLPPATHAGRPMAVTLSVRGECDCCEDGARFNKLERGHILRQGAIIRTGHDARTDLLFRRTGTSVRLQSGTEIRLEKMDVTFEDGRPIAYTLLDLRAGKIFTLVDSTAAGSRLEIRYATRRLAAARSGVNKCIISAEETHVWAGGSDTPIKVRGENGSTIIAAGERFTGKNSAMLPISNSLRVKDLNQLDELQTAAATFAAQEPSDDS